MTFSNSPSPGIALQGGGGSGGAGASAPLTGTGATVTTSQPLIDVSQTWNNAAVTFTGAKLNITDTASNAASLLMDLQVGGASKASISKIGTFIGPSGGIGSTVKAVAYDTDTTSGLRRNSTIGYQTFQQGNGNIFSVLSSNVTLQSGGSYGFASSTNSEASADLLLTRRGTGNLRLGAADAAAPVAQTLSVQSVVAGTTNTAGTNFTFTGSQGTGTGAGGSLIFQVAPAGGAPTVQNTLVDTLALDSVGSVRVVRALTVATLPATPLTGMMARVTNASAPAVGVTVAAGGAAQALCWYNGANWTVIGI